MKTIAGHALTALVTLGVAFAFFGGLRPLLTRQVPRPATAPAAANPPIAKARPAATPPALTDEEINIRVYAAVNRSVVNITSLAEGMGQFGDEPTEGSGSGFLIDRQGHILTNFHVIERAETLRVTLHDGTTLLADVVGVDPSNDVALLRVPDAEKLKIDPIPLGDTSNLIVGQKVLVVGNPFGLERTLTTGIISALDRTMQARNGRTIKGVVQTDAAINPGNSGGPLINSRGEVIGMTTAIISKIGQSAGIGFAVPINAVSRNLSQLIEHGKVIRADLGVRVVRPTEEGLAILAQEEGGPGDRAGLRALRARVIQYGPYRIRQPDPESADVIVAIDGTEVHNIDELLNEVEKHAPGETARVTILRGDRRIDVPVELGESP